MIDLFTEDEVRRAQDIMQKQPIVKAHEALCKHILTNGVMDRINAATKQENDRSYMAYRLEYIAYKAEL